MYENSKQFFEKMLDFFPAAKEEYLASIKEYGEVLETIVIEEVFMPKLLKLLVKNENSQLITNIFNYFEEVVNSNDIHLTNIISVCVLEVLGNDKAILEIAKHYMGTKTILLQIKSDENLGRL